VGEEVTTDRDLIEIRGAVVGAAEMIEQHLGFLEGRDDEPPDDEWKDVYERLLAARALLPPPQRLDSPLTWPGSP
jgi:hypothetical protein